jgi:D-amino-acid dehydrogenase
MNVLVLGSGVTGIACAWYLQRDGHDVTVIDRHDGPAMETSFANGGQMSWGAASPWAAPDVPWLVLKWLFRPHSPLVLRPRFDPAMWIWMARMLGNIRPERYARNKERMLRLGRYSHECLAALRHDTGIEYDAQRRGALVLHREARDIEHAAREFPLLDRLGIDHRLFDRDACVRHEPALAGVKEKIAGGVYFPGDESGDCRKFTTSLAAMAARHGVRFAGSTTIERLVAAGDRIERVITSAGEITADACVLACGSYSPLLMRPLGIRLPVYPVKGYSITVPITNDAAAPQGTLTDETYKIVITRLGDRMRAAGTAELAGYDLSLRPSRLATLVHVVRDLFPHAGDVERAEPWTGLRPMTPDNPPILGVTPYRNLFLNTGHGTLGWTLSCGSGKVLADIISGRKPELDMEGLTLARFS